MIDASRVNVVREALKSKRLKTLSNNTTLVKGKCVLVLVLITLLITIAYALH
jgi:hypothetical protein